MEDFLLMGAAVMSPRPPATDLARYARNEYGTPYTAWLTSSARRARFPMNGGRSGWVHRARALLGRIAAVFRAPLLPSRAPVTLTRAPVSRGPSEDAMGAAMFLTTPRRRTVDTSELGRYMRLEYGDEDPAWIVPDLPVENHDHDEALMRWLQGEDAAFEEWLSEPESEPEAEPEPEQKRTPARLRGRRPVIAT